MSRLSNGVSGGLIVKEEDPRRNHEVDKISIMENTFETRAVEGTDEQVTPLSGNTSGGATTNEGGCRDTNKSLFYGTSTSNAPPQEAADAAVLPPIQEAAVLPPIQEVAANTAVAAPPRQSQSIEARESLADVLYDNGYDSDGNEPPTNNLSVFEEEYSEPELPVAGMEQNQDGVVNAECVKIFILTVLFILTSPVFLPSWLK